MDRNQRVFYGWFLVGIAFVFYGFGISPAYYSWGLLGRAMSDDLGFTREQFGTIFGLFALLYSVMSAVSGPALGRWGVRAVVTAGLLLTAVGFVALSFARNYLETLLAFGIIIGSGVGISTIIPAQALASNWFIRYRARAIAVIFAAGGVVAQIITPIDAYLLRHGTWRTAWLSLAGLTVVVAVISVIFIRNRPEDLGLEPDGRGPEPAPSPKGGGAAAATAAAGALDAWTARQAFGTVQFAIITACSIAYAVPWGVVVPHGPSHLTDLGFTTQQAAAMIGSMALVSVAGRLIGGVGDFLPPKLVLAVSLIIEGLGVAGLIFADTKFLAYASCITIGIGFGTAYISVPVVLASYFGRVAFASTSGVRTMIVGVFNAISPKAAGWIADRTGSYDGALIALAALAAAGGVLALIARAPGLPPGADEAKSIRLPGA